MDIKHRLICWVDMSNFYHDMSSRTHLHRLSFNVVTHREMMSNVHQQQLYGNIAEQWTWKFFQSTWGGRMETWRLVCLNELIFFLRFLYKPSVRDIRFVQRSVKKRGCLLSYSQAEPGRELTQPSPRLLAEPCTPYCKYRDRQKGVAVC